MVSRRDFLKGLGAMALTPFAGKGILGAAKTAAKVSVPEIAAKGMPDWFPLLVNKIKTQGKQTTTATGGRNSENTYTLKSPDDDDYILYEDAISGNIQISTRGDDLQQVNFEYIPETKYSRPDGKSFVEESEFSAGEFMKGHEGLGDVEQIGTIDELRFGINSIEEFAKKGNKTTKEELQDIVNEFKRTTLKEDIDGFAKGGRVGYNNGGGVGTLFKRKKHNG